MKARSLCAGGLVLAMVGAWMFAASDVFPTEKTLPLQAHADRIVIEKSRHQMTLMEGEVVLKTYTVSLGRGGSDPKREEGDNKVPEGKYHIAGRKQDSAFHRALRLSYPEPRDIESTKQRGVDPGSDIMIHGLRNGMGWLGRLHRLMDWTRGCIAVTNSEIEEIWRVVPDGTPVEIKQ